MSRTNELTKAILKLLHLHGFMAWRNNTGAFKADKRFIRFGDKGSPDVMAIDKSGRFYGIEVKTGKDKLRPDQAAWHENLKAHNGISIIAATIDDVVAEITA